MTNWSIIFTKNNMAAGTVRTTATSPVASPASPVTSPTTSPITSPVTSPTTATGFGGLPLFSPGVDEDAGGQFKPKCGCKR
ncbi:hypothetical protein DFA_11437 [Cavenderia fasciculata]|uniref:Uncharacterized protein n=1 Tax=Cavenderia fasciculata TaxID=261658 RepID=F4QCZ5_CACFS|nr:uncharacterized protein DFA_11437 [Cavenderia fasciculata]EGG13676.1 hypothetical protein DFA_11437 [Cavenderia fasciculata]|eukprot:XP_004350380.1 hypothetical protein DFA_11437 [Cavenderia fasciculata]